MGDVAMKSYIVQLLVLMIILGLFHQGFGTDAGQLPENRLRAVESNEDAYKLAMEYTGFDQSKDYKRPEGVSDICQLVTAKDTTNSILAGEVSNRIAWQVELQNVSLHLKGNTPDGITLGPVDFVIIIDSLTGIPLRISSIPKEPFERVAASPEQIKQLTWGYYGLPSELPVVTIFDIFNKCKFYPAIAKSIIIIYVLCSVDDSPPEPAWVIYLRGLPSLNYDKNTKNEYMTTKRRIYNAITGYSIRFDNRPYPLLSNDVQNE